MLTRLAMWIIPSLDNDMQTHLSLSYPIKSGYIGIKDAQYAENKDGGKIHHIGFRRRGRQKGRFGRPKIQFSSKVAKFAR